MRRFAWGGTAPLLLLLPSLGYALALGNISVRSTLNAPFQADIKLTSVSAGELDSARIKLASRDDFKRAGVQYAAILSDLRFSIVKRGGKSVLEVTSVAPVRDPFLDFLVEVVTRKGRMVRQYTVLIDPPELPAGFRPAPVAAPQVSPRSTGTIRRVAPTPLTSAPVSKPQRSSGTAGSSSRAAGGDTYGPTRRNDTLWDIARDNRPSNAVSMNQMMMALLRANPQAFRNNNVNNLKAGQTLTIPQQGEITQLSREEAKNAFQQQYRDWKAGVASAPPPKVERQVVSDSLRADAARIKAPAAASDSGELVLVAPREDDNPLASDTSSALDGAAQGGAEGAQPLAGSAGGAATENIDELRRQRDLAQEQAYTAAQESRELLRRTDELEGRLAELERALQLRDADIAAMQQRAGATAGETGMEPRPTMDEGANPELEPGSVDGAGGEPSGIEPGAELAADDAGSAVSGDTEPAATDESTMATEPDISDIPIEPAPTLMDMAAENWDKVAAVLGLLGVGGLGVFLTRRRRRDDDLAQFDDSDVVEMPKVTGGDVLTEVNQYLAYGRPQQAEERLKQAMIAEPDRIELPTKLLEVYSRTGNKEAFDALAGEVYNRMGKNSVSADWQRIAGMGRRLSPNNPLYAPIGGHVGGMAAETPAAPPPPAPKPAAATGSGMATGVAAAAAGAASVAAAPAAAQDEDDGPAFDELEQELRRLEMEIGAAVAEEDTLESPADASISDADSDLSGDFGMGASAGDTSAAADDGMDFDLSFDDLEKMDSPAEPSLSMSGDTGAENSAQAVAEGDAAGDFDDGALDFDWGSDDDVKDDAADSSGTAGVDELSSALDSDFAAPADTDLAFDSVDLGDLGDAELVQGGAPEADVSLTFDDTKAEQDADVALSFDDLADLEPDTPKDADSNDSADDILSFDDIADDSDTLSFDDIPAADADDAEQEIVDLSEFGGEDLELGSAADSDLEELTTKLDLARAYVDMEDRDSAIDILDEVLKDASGTVRSEAEALRKQLG